MDCFENLVGLAPSGGDCITTLTAESKKSTSGLYLSELEETSSILKVLKGVSPAEAYIIVAFAVSLKSAVAAFREKLFTEIGSRYTVRQKPYVGLIGQNASTAALTLTGTYGGAAYEMLPLKGGVLTVPKIFVALNQSTTVQVTVWKAYVVGGRYELQGEALATIDVTAVGGTATPKTLDAPLVLPLTDESGHTVHYLFLYDRTDGFQPMNVKATCGCSGQNDLARWLTQSGVQGPTTGTIPTSSRNHTYSNGIVLSAEIKCSDTGFVCDAYGANPFIKTAVEHAVLYQTASNVITAILRSDSLNRFALTKREQMATDAAILHGKFKSRVPWIAENMDMKGATCYVCNTINESRGPYKTGIRF